MTPAELKHLAYRIVGPRDEWRWQSALADRIGMHRATICKWYAGQPIPLRIELLLKELAK